MEHQKIINLLNQLSKFRTKYWIEMNDQSRGVYNINSDIRFKNKMLKSSLCGYSDAYIHVTGRVIIAGAGDDDAEERADKRKEGVILKNGSPFINCKSEINNTEIDNAKDIDIVMLMYGLIEYSDNYSKTSGSFWQYYKDNPNDNLTDSGSSKSKVKKNGYSPDDGHTKDAEIMVPLKHLNNFWRNLETPFISCEVNLILTWSSACAIANLQVKEDLQ